jgi:futalosine hydrolase
VRLLVVASTEMEVAPLVAQLRPASRSDARAKGYTRGAHDVDLLIAGIGMVATAARCSAALARERYEAAFNFGLCGTFDRSIALGEVVHVATDCLSEIGAEDGTAFLTLRDLNLPGDNESPLTCGRLVNDCPAAAAAVGRLRAVNGITVNTVHGSAESIARVVARLGPDVESMEGAAFMYACLIHAVPFAQVRAVSNVVETRNRDAWDVPAAIRNLTETALRIIDEA